MKISKAFCCYFFFLSSSAISISLNSCDGTFAKCFELSSSGYLYRHSSYLSFEIAPSFNSAACFLLS